MSKQEKSFVQGAMILASAGIFVRFLGAVYRIPLYRILGDVGMGYFQMAYPIYSSLLAISTAGIPIAISKMVAERMANNNIKGAYQVLRIALTLMLITGFTFSVVLFFGAEYWATNIMEQPPAVYSLRAIAPGIFLVVIMAAFRGFFQGNQTMVPTAVSQISEQIIRVATIFYLSWVLLGEGVQYAAAGATFGVVTGSLAGVGVLLIYFMFYRRENKDVVLKSEMIQQSTSKVLKQMVLLALPITIASLVLPLIQMVDLAIVPQRLKMAGFTELQAAALYGNLAGAAMPLVNVPTLFTLALASSLIPSISSANALKNYNLIRSRASLAIKLTLLIGLPSAIGMFVLAEPISLMLYDNIAVATPLMIACFAVIFLTVHQTTSGILQGMGKTIVPVTNLLIGLVFKVAINYFLTGIPAINIKGPALGTVVSYLVSSSLNVYILFSAIGLAFSFKEFVFKPLITSGGMGLVVYVSYPVFKNLVNTYSVFQQEQMVVAMSTLLSVAIGVMVYGILLLVTGTITKKELQSIPKVGNLLVKILSKFKLLR